MGDQFLVNAYTFGLQSYSTAVVNSPASFTVVWWSSHSGFDDTDGYSIQGRQFSIAFFHDGFESGDMSGWSSISP